MKKAFFYKQVKYQNVQTYSFKPKALTSIFCKSEKAVNKGSTENDFVSGLK